MPKTSRDTTKRGRGDRAPLSFEQTLRLEHEPDKNIPHAIKQELTRSRLYLHGLADRRDLDDCVTSVDGSEQAWMLRLPSEVSLGLPGRSAE